MDSFYLLFLPNTVNFFHSYFNINMARKQFQLEYVIRSSTSILYEFLAQPTNLAQWFCDFAIRKVIFSFSVGPDLTKELVRWKRLTKSL